MDTNTFEPEQEAAAPGDFLQQEPHVEVVGTKSSVDLSYERSAEGVSTTRLQTKKLSGTQRKSLARERKMKEGTRTDKKPLRKIPSSQVDAVGSGGRDIKYLTLTRAHRLRKNSNLKNPGTLMCRLGHTRKLLLVSRWQLFTDVILM
jgi:hypothetical protein